MLWLKRVGVVLLWVALSFMWVGLGQSRAKKCENYGQAVSWLKPYLILNDWYHFYLNEQNCTLEMEDFLRVLAASETLSTKLNQAKVTFDQFYTPIYHLLELDWEKVDKKDFQNVQSDLSVINDSLRRTMLLMPLPDQDYFRAVVLLGLQREFVQLKKFKTQESEILEISRRLNQEAPETHPPRSIHFQEVVPPPYSPNFSPNK